MKFDNNRLQNKMTIIIFILLFSITSTAFSKEKTLPVKRIYSLIDYKGLAVFKHSDDYSGYELMISDGSRYGTRVIKDIDPGPGGSQPTTPAVWNDHLYFFAENTELGWSLWKSDGTDDGTIPIAKSVANHDSYIRNIDFIGQVGETGYFESGNMLISTKGTHTTTKIYDDLISSGNGSSVVGARLYFSQSTYRGQPVIYSVNSRGQFAQVFNQFNLEFGACQSGVRFVQGDISGNALFLVSSLRTGDKYDGCKTDIWLTNGTPIGTRKVFSPNQFSFLGVLDNKIILIETSDNPYNRKVYATTNGVNLDYIDTVNSSGFEGIIIGNKLAIEAYSPDDSFNETYLVGTTRGDIERIPISYSAQGIFRLPNGLIIGRSVDNRDNLMSSNGTRSGTQFISNFDRAEDWAIGWDDLGASTGRYVWIKNSRRGERELWHTNGTSSGTKLVFEAEGEYSQGIYNNVFPQGTEGQRLFFAYGVAGFSGEARQSYRTWQTDGRTANPLFYKYSIRDEETNQGNTKTYVNMSSTINLLLDEED